MRVLAILLVALTLAACDIQEPPGSTDVHIGRWELVSFTAEDTLRPTTLRVDADGQASGAVAPGNPFEG